MKGLLRLLLAVLFLLPASRAAAELYRCDGPGGSVRYSDDPTACPGARPHEPAADVQRFASPPPPAAVAPSSALAPSDNNAAQESAWRQRHRAAQGELEQLTREVENLERSVTRCNQGAKLLIRDKAGLNRELSCDRVRARQQSKRARLAQVRTYLAEGIHEECRRAGCLPGWLR